MSHHFGSWVIVMPGDLLSTAGSRRRSLFERASFGAKPSTARPRRLLPTSAYSSGTFAVAFSGEVSTPNSPSRNGRDIAGPECPTSEPKVDSVYA